MVWVWLIDYIQKLTKSDYRRAIKFNGCYRLLDDISAINSDEIFEEAIPFIYPESLTLNKENDGNISTKILDLSVELNVNSKTCVTNHMTKVINSNFQLLITLIFLVIYQQNAVIV